MPLRKRRFRNTWMAKGLLSLFGFFLGWLLLEIGLRAGGFVDDPWQPPDDSVLQPSRGNRYVIPSHPFILFQIPGSVYSYKYPGGNVRYEINSLGFRGAEFPRQTPEGKKRLLVIGDSMVEGYGVEFEQSFPAVMNKAVKDKNWEVINAGTQGASPILYAANLPRYLALNPDAVLLVLYGNDLRDDCFRESVYESLITMPDAERLVTGRKRRTKPISRVLTFTLKTLRRYLPWKPHTDLDLIHARHAKENPILQEGFNFAIPNSKRIEEEEWPDVWNISSDYLDVLAEGLEEAGIPLFVIHLTAQIDETEQYHTETFERLLWKWAEEKHLPHLSLFTEMRKAAEADEIKAMILTDNIHLSPSGNQAAADILIPWLEQQGALR